MDANLLEDLALRRARARRAGSDVAEAKLRESGKLTARERVELLLDAGSFVEMGLLAHSQHAKLRERTPADGVIVGHGKIDGRIVYVAADDYTVLGGTRGRVGEVKIGRVRAAALAHRKPFIALMEAGAARVQEAFGAMAAGVGSRFGEHFRMSGKVPQCAAILGGCFGGPSFTAAQSDFVTIARGTGQMGVSGPLLVKIGIGESLTPEEIGGAEISGTVTGQSDHVGEDDKQCLAAIRRFLSYFPSSCHELPPVAEPREAPIDTPAGRQAAAALVPSQRRRGYDVRKLLELLADGGELFYYRPGYGPNLATAWGRMQGHTVGFVASNPMFRAGVLDEKTTNKARKFVELCDAFHIPLIFLVDVPGFLVGPEIEKQRMVSLAARFLNTVCAATVPKTTIVIRKAIGLAYLALGGRVMNPDTIVAWPTAHFDVMGPEAGVELAHGKELAGAEDPTAKRAEIMERLEAQSSAYAAAAMGLIDDVIDPAETRNVILQTLEKCAAARRPGWKHRVDP